jgi:preprotein translocase subunit SecB
MADEQTPDLTEEQAIKGLQGEAAQFQVHKLYMKDISFEVPNAPQIFQDNGQADIKMNLAQRVDDLGENMHDVVLTVTVTAMMGEKTAYLAEVHQAGIFMITGFNEQGTHAALNTLCPHTLFPYARQAISYLVTEGGFPPLVLQPINFDQIYSQRMIEAQQKMSEEGTPDLVDVEGNA